MDPTLHFTKEQIEILRDIYHAETNKLLVKIISANLVTIVFAVGAVGIGWYRLGHIEENVSAVTVAFEHKPVYTKEEHQVYSQEVDRRFSEVQATVLQLRTDYKEDISDIKNDLRFIRESLTQ